MAAATSSSEKVPSSNDERPVEPKAASSTEPLRVEVAQEGVKNDGKKVAGGQAAEESPVAPELVEMGSLLDPNSAEAKDKLKKLQQELLLKVGLISSERLQWSIQATMIQSKWDETKALARLCELDRFMKQHPELFDDLTPEEFVKQAELGMTSYLPTRNSRGQLVILLHAEKLNDFVRHFNQTDMLRFSVYLMMKQMAETETQVNGVIILENLYNYPMMAVNKTNKNKQKHILFFSKINRNNK
jgi:hypothetical protein